MSVITKEVLLEKMSNGSIGFNPPLDEYQLHNHSVDLRLGFTFVVPKRWHMTQKGREALTIDHFDPKNPDYFEVLELEKGQYFELLPREHISVATFEAVKIPEDVMAVLYPRSSTNRRGLSVDLTGIVDAGYEGQLIIPIRNNTETQTIRLYPGERFCQLVFETLDSAVIPRLSKYHKHDIIEGFIPDKEKENKFITTGEILALKKQFPAIELPATDKKPETK